MTPPQPTSATKSASSYVAMIVCAIATLVSAFAAPLIAPALAVAGIVASTHLARRGAGVMRWLPPAIFTIALVVSLAIDLGLLAARSGIVGVGPADAPAN